jgi:hypothetical protein
VFLVYWCESLLGVHYCYYTSSARCLVFLNWVELLYGIYYSRDEGEVPAGIEPRSVVQQAGVLSILSYDAPFGYTGRPPYINYNSYTLERNYG